MSETCFWNSIQGDQDRLQKYSGVLSVRSISDLNSLILANLSRITEFNVIVGVPRSGMLVANIIALHLNLPLMTLQHFLAGELRQVYTRRTSRSSRKLENFASETSIKVLIVDDTVASGGTLLSIKADVEQRGLNQKFVIKYLAAYVESKSANVPDLFLSELPQPRVFEWNLLHHVHARLFCCDLDGVLCDDPTIDENDDGPRYRQFCLNAKPKILPSVTLGAIVTARLEAYRPETETWLAQNGVAYDRLVMCNLPTGQERRRLAAHAKLKADVYNVFGGLLFVESDLKQSEYIRSITRKPVYCFGTSKMLT